eukprot:656414-Amphidinium_carterae.1
MWELPTTSSTRHQLWEEHPLLGLRELSNSHFVYLPRSKQLRIVQDEHLINWPDSPPVGTKTVHLSESPNGHLLLPFLQPKTSTAAWSYQSSMHQACEQRQQQRSTHDLATNDHRHIFAKHHNRSQLEFPLNTNLVPTLKGSTP